jgi:hypothetical protein
VVTHEFSDERADKLAAELKKEAVQLLHGEQISEAKLNFECVFLIDDFIGSGTSYLRMENGNWAGKLASFAASLEKGPASRITDPGSLKVFVVSYLITEQANGTLRSRLEQRQPPGSWKVLPVHLLGSNAKLTPESDGAALALCSRYYDPTCETESVKKGGTDARFGFARVGIPLVLSHNTPNNAPFLLWADPAKYRVRGLFPRIERHKQ